MEENFDQDQHNSINFFDSESISEEEKADNFIFDEPEIDTRFEIPIIDFSEPKMIDLMEVYEDLDMGGLSESQIGYCGRT